MSFGKFLKGEYAKKWEKGKEKGKTTFKKWVK
jgi:hypothetical protein